MHGARGHMASGKLSCCRLLCADAWHAGEKDGWDEAGAGCCQQQRGSGCFTQKGERQEALAGCCQLVAAATKGHTGLGTAATIRQAGAGAPGAGGPGAAGL